MPEAHVSFKDINAAWFVGEVPGVGNPSTSLRIPPKESRAMSRDKFINPLQERIL